MDDKVNYALVGLFVVVIGVLAVVLFFWLSTYRHNIEYNAYLVYAEGGVAGLTTQSPVQYNGVKIGFVDSIDLNPQNPQQVRLILQIQEGSPITTSTVATLVPQGITGLVYVGLSAQTPHAPLLTVEPGHRYPVIHYQVPLLARLNDVLTDVGANLQTISDRVQRLLNDQNQQALTQTLQNVEHLTSALGKNAQSIDKLLQNSAQASQQLATTLNSIQAAGDSVNRFSQQATATLKKGDVMMNGLGEQVVPGLQQLLGQLNQVAIRLNGAVGELERNPSMLLRGKEAPAKGPGE